VRKSINYSKRFNSGKIEWKNASDVTQRVEKIIKSLKFDWKYKKRILCFRSSNAKTRAYARIWGLSRIWQKALKIPPAYILEVISEKYDKLSETKKDEILIHELSHIPQNFSGSLIPHIRRGKRNFYAKVKRMIYRYSEVL
jgi:predicted metallopeptidase